MKFLGTKNIIIKLDAEQNKHYVRKRNEGKVTK